MTRGRTILAGLVGLLSVACRTQTGELEVRKVERVTLFESGRTARTGEAQGPKKDADRDPRASVELVTIELGRGRGAGPKVYALYAHPEAIRSELLTNPDRQHLAELAPDALAVVNAAFFTDAWKPTGLLVSGGKTLNRLVKKGGAAGSGVFVLEDGGASLFRRSEASKRTFESAQIAVQAGPRVIEPGGKAGIRSDDGIRANRTIVGVDRRGRVAIACIVGPSGPKSGLSLFEVQSLFTSALTKTDHADLALDAALNLDGGPSTGLHVRHDDHGVDAPEASPVYSAIAIRIRR